MTQIQSRDQEILAALSRRVRLFSLAQIASFWWEGAPSSVPNARRRLAKLVDMGLLAGLRVLAQPLPPLTEPLARWRPGQGEPDLAAVAWQLQKRWSTAPRETPVYVATRRAAGLFGGRARGELRRELQAAHDLGVAAVYLHFLGNLPALAEYWVGEDLLRQYRIGQKIPDAVLAESPRARPTLVLEFGGAYTVRRLRQFHKHCAEDDTPYEIW